MNEKLFRALCERMAKPDFPIPLIQQNDTQVWFSWGVERGGDKTKGTSNIVDLVFFDDRDVQGRAFFDDDRPTVRCNVVTVEQLTSMLEFVAPTYAGAAAENGGGE